MLIKSEILRNKNIQSLSTLNSTKKIDVLSIKLIILELIKTDPIIHGEILKDSFPSIKKLSSEIPLCVQCVPSDGNLFFPRVIIASL